MPGLHEKAKSEEIEKDNAESSEQQIFNNENRVYFPQGRHVWRQQGPYVVCRSCELHHAVYVGMKLIMVGEDAEGKPILRDKVSVEPS